MRKIVFIIVTFVSLMFLCIVLLHKFNYSFLLIKGTTSISNELPSFNDRAITIAPNSNKKLSIANSGFCFYENMIAIIIGIDRYQNLSLDDQLNYAVHDARGVASLLQEKYSFNNIIRLYNEKATRNNIMKVLQGDLSNTGKNDAVLIYFAGHGITRLTLQSHLGYLLPYDGSVRIDEMHKNISMQQIKADVCPIIPAKHVLLIADACFGGLLLTRSASIEPNYTISYLKEKAQEPVRHVITAGSKDERVLDDGISGHSVFTGRLIEILSNVDNYITAAALGENLKLKVYGDAAAKGHTQTPLSGKIYGVGDFIFVPDNAKKEKLLNAQIAFLKKEIQKYEQLKENAKVRKNSSKVRELERNRLIQQAELRRKELEIESVQKRAKLKKLEQEELYEQNKRDIYITKQKKIRLDLLKQKTIVLKKKLGEQLNSFGLVDTIKEIRRINISIQNIYHDFQNEIKNQTIPIVEFYQNKIDKLKNKKNKRKSKYETRDAFLKKQIEYDNQINDLKHKIKENIQKIEKQLNVELYKQTKPFYVQIKNISKQVFPINIKDITINIDNFDPEKEKFFVHLTIDDIMCIYYTLEISRSQARKYNENPELLIPDVSVIFNENGFLIPKEVSFLGMNKQKIKGYMTSYEGVTTLHYRTILDKLIFNATVVDRRTGKMWAVEDSEKTFNWYEAKQYCEKYTGGGYNDWRMPTIVELESLYNPRISYSTDSIYISEYYVSITPLIILNRPVVWSSNKKASSASCYYFTIDEKFRTKDSDCNYNKTVLPVRDYED